MSNDIKTAENPTNSFKEKPLFSTINRCIKNQNIETKVMLDNDFNNYHAPEIVSFPVFPTNLSNKNIVIPRAWGSDISQSKYMANFLNKIALSIIILNADSFMNKVLNIAISENIDLTLIDDLGGERLFPQTDCESVDFNYDTNNLVQDYAPSRILLYPLSTEHELYDHYMFGIYLLDNEDNFMCRQFFEIFHEDIAPNGCKKLKIPKTTTEFNQLYGFDC